MDALRLRWCAPFRTLRDGRVLRRIARGSLICRMQRFEEGNERSGLRRAQVFPVSRHIAAPLDHLADELVLREPNGNAIQGRASLPSGFTQRMAVAALFALEDKCASPLKRRCAAEEFIRHRISAPGVHVRT